MSGGEYGVKKFELPNAGEFCKESCDSRGDGVSVPGYSGTVLGIRSGDPACDERYGLLVLLVDLSLLTLVFEFLLA